MLADLSTPRDLERLNRLEERNRRREVAYLPIPERDRSSLMPESLLHQEEPPQSIRSASITPMPSGSVSSGEDDRNILPAQQPHLTPPVSPLPKLGSPNSSRSGSTTTMQLGSSSDENSKTLSPQRSGSSESLHSSPPVRVFHAER